MNKYKNHHKILSFLSVKLFEYYKDDFNTIKHFYFSNELNKLFKISKINTECILEDLLNDNSVIFSKYYGYKISEIGIRKVLSKYYVFKHIDNRWNKIKDFTTYTVSLLAILTFTFTIYWKYYEDNKLDKKIKNLEIQLQKVKQEYSKNRKSNQKNKLKVLRNPNTQNITE